jgi:hypothetical protein
MLIRGDGVPGAELVKTWGKQDVARPPKNPNRRSRYHTSIEDAQSTQDEVAGWYSEGAQPLVDTPKPVLAPCGRHPHLTNMIHSVDPEELVTMLRIPPRFATLHGGLISVAHIFIESFSLHPSGYKL